MNQIALKKSLQEICSDKNMKALEYVAALMIQNWNKGSSIGSSEWETVKLTIMKEERQRALRLFFDEIEKLAHE